MSDDVVRVSGPINAAGLEMTLAGVIVGGATYAVGLAFPT